MVKHFCFGLFLSALVFAVGCGKGYTPVTGKVTWEDGSPVTQGSVVLDDGTYSSRGTITAGGEFSVGFEKDGEGVPPGKYNVAVQASDSELRAPSGKLLFDPKFSSPASSGLSIDVQGGQKNSLDIVLQKNPDLTPEDNKPPVDSEE